MIALGSAGRGRVVGRLGQEQRELPLQRVGFGRIEGSGDGGMADRGHRRQITMHGHDDRRFAVPRAPLARAGRRTHPVRRVPAVLQAARGPARPLLRARAPGRRAGADHLRALVRLLHRPDREEAAEPFPARNAGVLVRHSRLQPDLQVLPELRHQQGARDRSAERGRDASDDRRCGAATRLPLGRVHLQRSGDLPGIRGRHRACVPRGWAEDGGSDRRLHHAARHAASSTPTSTRRTWT